MVPEAVRTLTVPDAAALPELAVTVATSVRVWLVTALAGATSAVVLLAMTTPVGAAVPAPPVLLADSWTSSEDPTSSGPIV